MGSRKDLSEGEMEDDGGIEEENTDSLDIKPPQAQRVEKKHKKKTTKEKKHGKHKHRKSNEDRMPDRYEGSKYHRRERGAGYAEYFQHASRPGRDQQMRYDQNYRVGGDRGDAYGGNYNNKRGHYQERGHHHDRGGFHGRGGGNANFDRSQERRAPEPPPPRPRRPQTPEEDADKILDDLRNKLLMKKNKHDAMEKQEAAKEKEEKKRKHRSSDEKRSKKNEDEDEELVARRARLLQADREMVRRKEAAREELEARREKRRETEKSPSPSPKKKRTEIQNTPPKRKQEEVVMVSDHSEEEAEEEEDDEETDSESDSKSEVSMSEESQHSKESSEGELPGSPLSVGELSKSEERRRRSDSRQRHALHSSRSRSHTPHSETESGSDESHTDSQGSRSPSHSGDESLEKRKRSDNTITGASPKREGPKTPKSSDEKAEDEVELPPYFPAIQGCRSVEEFQCLNRIEEGTYGVVYRAKDKRTEEIVALKRLKMEKEKEGFPITSLREINTLLKGQHPNIVTVREIVVGSNMDKIFIVMDYVEHDLKSLMETMKHKKQFFLPGEVKCLLQQLLRAVAHLHDNWILHRDLKTSNLLLSHKGILKVGDFGLAREYGSPLKAYTPIVVTLWYRAPELLLCCKEYSTPIDIWSVGCIFSEFLSMQPLFPGKSEVDQLNRIFKDLGTPNEKIWPGYNELPAVQKMTFTEYPVSNLRKKFSKFTSELGLALIQGLLTYDPKQRLTAEKALQTTYFKELPLPIDPAMFPTWPAKSELGLKKALASSPKPPSGGTEFKRLGEDANEPGFHLAAPSFAESRQLQMGPGFSLKF